jgi:hypothetical protein
MTSELSMARWKLVLADLGGTLVATGVFYMYDLLALKVSIVFVGSVAAYNVFRHYVLKF